MPRPMPAAAVSARIKSPVPINMKDCNGVCFGRARENRCGHCVGGDTGKDQNFGKFRSSCGLGSDSERLSV